MTSRRKDSAQLLRQWLLLRLLSGSGRSLSVKELAERVGSSKSTIERDLATLGSHFPLVEEEAGKVKRTYRIDRRVRALELLSFGAMELVAADAAAVAAGPLAGTSLHRDLLDVGRKIRGALAGRASDGLDRLRNVFGRHPRDTVSYEAHDQTVDDLVTAIAQRRVCTVTYQGPWHKEPRTVAVRPLRLVEHKGALYLFCRSPRREGVTTLAVHRISALTVSHEGFSDPGDEATDAATRAFGIFEHKEDDEDVEILFSATWAWRVLERTFHPDERKVRLDDGRVRYTVRTSSKWEIIPWVLTYGGEAELVAPASWRAELSACAMKAASLHDGPNLQEGRVR